MSKTRRPAPASPSNAGPVSVLIGGAMLLAAAVAFALWPQTPAAPAPTAAPAPSVVPAATAAPAASASQIQVDKELVDFGDVKLGTWVQADFKLTNAGPGPLTFTEPPYIELVEGC